LRTVLEATSAGLTIQSCGTYRGTGSANRKNITSTNSFETAWGGMPGSGFYPSEAPAMCERCIDVSMNVTLGALATIIQNDRSAKFYRIRLDTKELADLHAGSLLPGDRQLPAWTRMPTAITRTS
ncbi:MAG: hypothetical protein ACR2Q4_14950, partial [Geminicoccaceae bacterium]